MLQALEGEWKELGGTAGVEARRWEAPGSGQQDDGPEGSGKARLQGRGG